MTEIYKSCNTVVYECDNYYMIKNEHNNYAVVTDKNKKILEALSLVLGGKRSLQFNPNTNYFYIVLYDKENRKYKFFCNLRQLIVAATLEGDFYDNLKDVKKGQIKLKNVNKSDNYCFDNLEYSRAFEDSSINTFWDDGEYFYIKHNSSGFVVKTDLCEPLNNLIKRKRWYLNDANNYKKLVAIKEENHLETMALHRYIAFYRYYNEAKSYESWYEIYGRLLEKLKVCVDHIDNDLSNCTSSNLEIIKKGQNAEKGTLVLKCNKTPFKCNAFLEEDFIHLKMGYSDKDIDISVKSIYDNPADFINALKDFYCNGIVESGWHGRILLPQTPKECA